MSALKKWMQTNEIFDKDLLHLLPKYGVVNPDKDLQNLSSEKWGELQRIVLNEKRSELKDNASNLRFKKKLNKITKLWKEKQNKNAKNAKNTKNINKKTRSTSNANKNKKRSSIANKNNKARGSIDSTTNELEELRAENRRIRRELSSKNSDHNRLQQEFNSYKKIKDDELKKLNTKYQNKNDEYNKIYKLYKSLQQQINSKYHNKSAKDKVIDNLKIDKETLMNDINQIMKKEQEKYDTLLNKYTELKKSNKVNAKYKLKYKKQKSNRGHNKNYTFDLGTTFKMDQHSKWTDDDSDDDKKDFVNASAPNLVALDQINQSVASPTTNGDELFNQLYRPRKFKPSKEKRERARRLSEVVTPKTKQKNNII